MSLGDPATSIAARAPTLYARPLTSAGSRALMSAVLRWPDPGVDGLTAGGRTRARGKQRWTAATAVHVSAVAVARLPDLLLEPFRDGKDEVPGIATARPAKKPSAPSNAASPAPSGS
jgi:hypothetical protein